MKSFGQYILEKYNLSLPKGEINGEWFHKNGLPMIVACSCCDMTMASPNCYVDDDGCCYCSGCADIDEMREGA